MSIELPTEDVGDVEGTVAGRALLVERLPVDVARRRHEESETRRRLGRLVLVLAEQETAVAHLNF